MAELNFKNVIKKYGKTEVIHKINLDINNKEFNSSNRINNLDFMSSYF